MVSYFFNIVDSYNGMDILGPANFTKIVTFKGEIYLIGFGIRNDSTIYSSSTITTH